MSLPGPVKLAKALNPPQSLREFGHRFHSETDCEEFLFQVRYPDGWDGYRRLQRSGYLHQRIVQGKGRKALPILPHIHRVFSNLKAWLHGTHHGCIEPRYLQAYLDEYTFRFNRRFWPGPAFLRALTIMVQPKHKI